MSNPFLTHVYVLRPGEDILYLTTPLLLDCALLWAWSLAHYQIMECYAAGNV